MAVLKFSDLSSSDQKAVRATLNGGSVHKRGRPSHAETRNQTPYRCSAHDERFPTFVAAERHARSEGHGGARLEALS